jgi:hypothetical protein
MYQQLDTLPSSRLTYWVILSGQQEENRKGVRTAHQIVKSLTGELASNSLIPLQV